MSRRQSRKSAMQLIYEMNMNGDYDKNRIEEFCKYQNINKNDKCPLLTYKFEKPV
mgnify:CR=1 FL=1